MNELQRQAYLSSLGIDNYAPRWVMPFAPVSIACEMPEVSLDFSAAGEPVIPSSSILSSVLAPQERSASALSSTLIDLDIPKKAPAISNAAAILQQLEVKKAPVVQPFSLSIYRPQPGFLIIDSRNTTLALPTELLLSNLLRGYLGSSQFSLVEEVLRWPMIENSFVSRTEDDARNELQTWLAVENELRPISRLWLMGENAARYWVNMDNDLSLLFWTVQSINNLPLQGLILPSLNQLLQNPAHKSKVWASLP
ncbi:hypothetical protein [Cellvibrio sp. NN19]|uniref:hypothetical protein n=1 Tax=Cellvibrio chitinivorans TaxID=3102792 RepID=UPI002B4174A6|nr:hypothetical protein [Cellvibrio sp. NN19]